MSSVIAFLEMMGRDASLAHADTDRLTEALAMMPVAAQAQAAILDQDPRRLETLLDAHLIVFCGLFPGKEDDDEDDGDEPRKDDDEITRALGAPCVA